MALDQRANGTSHVRETLADLRYDATDLLDDVSTLVRKEVELAKAEVAEQVGLAKETLLWGGATFIGAFLAAIFLAVALMLVLDTFMPLVAAGIITAVLLVALTALAGMLAYSCAKRLSPTPKRTIESISEDVRWARNRMRFSEK